MVESIEIGGLTFEYNRKRGEMYISTEHEAVGMCELPPRYWDCVVEEMRKREEDDDGINRP